MGGEGWQEDGRIEFRGQSAVLNSQGPFSLCIQKDLYLQFKSHNQFNLAELNAHIISLIRFLGLYLKWAVTYIVNVAHSQRPGPSSRYLE